MCSECRDFKLYTNATGLATQDLLIHFLIVEVLIGITGFVIWQIVSEVTLKHHCTEENSLAVFLTKSL